MNAVEVSRRWRLAIIGIALAAMVVSLGFRPPDVPGEALAGLAQLTLLTAAGVMFPVHIGSKTKLGVAITPIFAAILLLGPTMAALVTLAGTTIGLTLRPFGSREARLFNVATLSLAACLAGWAEIGIAGTSLPQVTDQVVQVVTISVAGATFYLANTIVVAIAVDLRQRVPLLSGYVGDQRERLPQYLLLYLLGGLSAVLSADSLLSGLLSAVPMAIVGFQMHQRSRLLGETWRMVEHLADLIDLRDPYTAAHSRRVAEYALEICQELRLGRPETELISRAARLHDIGKLGMSGAIITEARPLTDEEWVEMKRHPELGEQIVGGLSAFKPGATIIRHHHERWDGRGYPDGIAGEAIPLGARVIAVADTFDAMTTDRPYRKALSRAVALAEIERNIGTQFDPRIAAAFLRVQESERNAPIVLPSRPNAVPTRRAA